MKKVLLVACLSLVMLVGAAPPAHAGGRFFVGFGIGFGGGIYRAYSPWYPRVYPPYAYGCYPAYGYYGPYAYARPYVAAPRVVYYSAPYYAPYRAYTLGGPRVRVTRAVAPRRVYAPPARNARQRDYGYYVPRRYGR